MKSKGSERHVEKSESPTLSPGCSVPSAGGCHPYWFLVSRFKDILYICKYLQMCVWLLGLFHTVPSSVQSGRAAVLGTHPCADV